MCNLNVCSEGSWVYVIFIIPPPNWSYVAAIPDFLLCKLNVFYKGTSGVQYLCTKIILASKIPLGSNNYPMFYIYIYLICSLDPSKVILPDFVHLFVINYFIFDVNLFVRIESKWWKSIVWKNSQWSESFFIATLSFRFHLSSKFS